MNSSAAVAQRPTTPNAGVPGTPTPPPATITPELLTQHGITPDEYRRIENALGRTPSLTELGILQRHVERALLLQILEEFTCAASPPKSDRIRPGTRRERRHYRRGRRMGPARSRLSRTITPVLHRAISGSGHRRRRHPARHLYHGRAAAGGDGLAAVRSTRARPRSFRKDVARQNHSIVGGVVPRHRRLWQLLRCAEPSAAKRSLEPCYSGNPLVNAFALGLVRAR